MWRAGFLEELGHERLQTRERADVLSSWEKTGMAHQRLLWKLDRGCRLWTEEYLELYCLLELLATSLTFKTH